MTTEDLDDLEDLEDETGEGEEEEDEEEPAGLGGLEPERANAEPPSPEPLREPKRRKRGRPRNPENVGKPPKPSTIYLTTRDVENLWPQVIVYAKKHLGIDPFGIDIRVKAISPQEYVLGTIPGGAVQGDMNTNPGSMLVEMIVDRFHIPMNPQGGQAQYKVEFIQRSTGAVIKMGTLTLPPVPQIFAMRRQKMEADAARPVAPAPAPSYQGAYPNAGYGAPPPPYGAPPAYPYYPAPQAGVGAPSQEAAAMLQELAFLRGTLQEAHQAAREGRQWQPPPVPSPQPAADPAAGLEDRLFNRLMGALQPILHPPAASAGVGASPPQAQAQATPIANSATGKLNSMIERVMVSALDKTAKSLEEAVRTGLGLGAAPPEPEPAVAEVMDPEDSLPFSVVPIPEAKWPDGRPVQFVRNRETGNIDISGALHSNPWVVEKAMAMAEGVMGAVTDVVKNMAKAAVPGQAEVVSNIPRSAVNAGAAPATDPHPPTQVQPQANGVGSPPATEWPRV